MWSMSFRAVLAMLVLSGCGEAEDTDSVPFDFGDGIETGGGVMTPMKEPTPYEYGSQPGDWDNLGEGRADDIDASPGEDLRDEERFDPRFDGAWTGLLDCDDGSVVRIRLVLAQGLDRVRGSLELAERAVALEGLATWDTLHAVDEGKRSSLDARLLPDDTVEVTVIDPPLTCTGTLIPA